MKGGNSGQWKTKIEVQFVVGGDGVRCMRGRLGGESFGGLIESLRLDFHIILVVVVVRIC